MQRDIIFTADGSASIAIPDMDVTYHSKHGAIQESMHVFIQAGLNPLLHKHPVLHIFEMGFGTGLNAFLSAIQADAQHQPIQYQSVEAYPLEKAITDKLNYEELLQQPGLKALFQQLHSTSWNQPVKITENFTLHKYNSKLSELDISTAAHLIYYDAFAPGAQPELWTIEIFKKLYNFLLPEGILVTYCSKSDVRRAMQAAGFSIEKIPGPPGKREMVRAQKKPAQ